MQKFITVTDKTGAPMLLPSDITHMAVTDSTDTKRPGDRNIMLSSRTAHNAGHYSEQTRGVSPTDITDGMLAAGKILVKMPFVWGDKLVGAHYVDPTSVTFISTSKPETQPNQDGKFMAVLIGLKGGGYVETYAVPEKTIHTFMDAAHAANPSLRVITPASATSRFYEAGFTAYDPADVVRIYPNGHQVNVLYRDGFCSDFNLPRVDYMGMHLGKLFDRVVRMRGNTAEAQDNLSADKPLMNRLLNHAGKFSKRKEASARNAFASAIAADCPSLYSFKDAEEFYYTSLKNVSRIVFAGKDPRELYVDYLESTPEGRGMHAGARHVMMKDDSAARMLLLDIVRAPG